MECFWKNRTSGAMLTYSVNKELVEGSGEDKKEEKVKIEIFDEEGEKLRTLETSPNETGINRTIRNLDRKGVRYPSRNSRSWGMNTEPGGASVLLVV